MMEKYELLKNAGRKVGGFLGDFFFANQTRRDLRYEEGFVREFYPEQIPIGDGRAILALESAIETAKGMRREWTIYQTATTALYVSVIPFYLSGEETLGEVLAMTIPISLAKLILWGAGRLKVRYQNKSARNIMDLLKEEDSGRYREGEEWKKDTDCDLSDEPGF